MHSFRNCTGLLLTWLPNVERFWQRLCVCLTTADFYCGTKKRFPGIVNLMLRSKSNCPDFWSSDLIYKMLDCYVKFCILSFVNRILYFAFYFFSEVKQSRLLVGSIKKILSTNSCENNFPLLRLNPSLSESSKSNQIQSNEVEDFSTSIVIPASQGGEISWWWFCHKESGNTWIRTGPLLRNLLLRRWHSRNFGTNISKW